MNGAPGRCGFVLPVIRAVQFPSYLGAGMIVRANGGSLRAALLAGIITVAIGEMVLPGKQAACSPTQHTGLTPDKKLPTVLESGPTPGARRGQWYEQVENRGTAPIVALALRYHCKARPIVRLPTTPPGAAAGDGEVSLPPDFPTQFPNGNGTELFDSLSADHQNFSIPPDGSSQIEWRLSDDHLFDCSARVDAVLFGDRSSAGNRRDLLRIYQKRQGIYEALVRAMPVVEAVANGQSDLPRALHALVRDERSLQPPPGSLAGGANYDLDSVSVPLPDEGWYTNDERTGAGQLYAAVVSALISQQGAARFPWKSAAVQHPAKNVGMPTDNSIQARAAVLLGEMQVWRGALEDHLQQGKRK